MAKCVICEKPCPRVLCAKHGKEYEATDGGDMEDVIRWAAGATRAAMRREKRRVRTDLRRLEQEMRELRSALRGFED